MKTHINTSQAVITGRENRCHFGHPCSRAPVHTTREHGPLTRVVITGIVYRTNLPSLSGLDRGLLYTRCYYYTGLHGWTVPVGRRGMLMNARARHALLVVC